MSSDNYKFKYIKYKKKYNELKKIKDGICEILNKVIIVPKEYNVLSSEQKLLFKPYELNEITSKPISYIKNEYEEKIILNECENQNTTTTLNGGNTTDEYNKILVLEKNIISPDEYFELSDSDKAKYSINESDYKKFPNRVVPKNYKKI